MDGNSAMDFRVESHVAELGLPIPLYFFVVVELKISNPKESNISFNILF